MSRIAIVTDSVTCIPASLLESLEIKSVPYYIHRGNEVLRDLVTIQHDEFYRWLPSAHELPTTACPGPGDYLAAYQQVVEETGADNLVSIHMSSKASGAYQAAQAAQTMAAESMPDIHIEVIDTLNAAMCHGWIAIEAARAALSGFTLSEILSLIKRMIPVTQMIQTADTLRYLYMGGRIGKAKHLVGSLLNIKPLISMQDGIIVPLGQARSRHRAYQMMVEILEETVGYLGKIKIAYLHAAAPEEVEKIKALLEARLTCAESLITELSPALGVHTGPGTAGFCYFPVAALES